MWRLVICLGLATACNRPVAVTTAGGGTAPTAAPGIPWFARADLVALDGGEVVGYAVTDALIEVGRLRVADAKAVADGMSGDWPDRDDLIVQSGDARVVHISAAGVTALRVPSESELAAPRPETDDSTELVSGGAGELVVAQRAAYWSRCAWGVPVDGMQCELYVHAELWPSPDIEQTERPLLPGVIEWQDQPAPPGFHTEAAERVLHCRPPAGAKVELTGNAKEDEYIYHLHWVSVSPPRLLVEHSVSGLDDMLPNSWSLYEGCGPAAIANGTRIVPGPHGLWAGEQPEPGGDSSRAVIWRGGQRIGVLPHSDGLRFRPAT